MHFHKYPYPANFEFISGLAPNQLFRTSRGLFRFNASIAEGDIYCLTITGKGWETKESQAGLRLPVKLKGLQGETTELKFSADGAFSLKAREGGLLLSSLPGRFFGQCGVSSVFEFIREEGDVFYGMGEKLTGFEHSGKTVKFWNTDVWGDFHRESYINGSPPADPSYVSIPYLILKRGDSYLGLLMDNPHATFISTKHSIPGDTSGDSGKNQGLIHLGEEEGQPSLYVICGPSLPELTRKVQKLMGTTPLPPAWSLGYHQCRWGYQSERDLMDLDRAFRRHKIPVDGLWLDIDYMRGYRVFTFDSGHFPNPAKTVAKLESLGRKVVPILDPGVKCEKGYDVYESGHRAGIFCLNPQGREYVGLVWPGETVFPDYSMKSGCAWWSGEVSKFASQGIHGAWLDMNDPATGHVDNFPMLFNKGRKAHSTYHNQYALGMARASRDGLLKAHPNRRPFLLCRSGYTGSGRYTAIWTGDNYSNYHHLKNSIAVTLNLALSGIPFNGPDAGGFGGDTWPELIRDWFKAGFLFPVFRNHCHTGQREQEPWAFDSKTLEVLRHYIRLRYRFRPYLYQLFAEHERSGEAILRPLFYDFISRVKAPLEKIDDQFMVGPLVLQAPFVEEKKRSRHVLLPGTGRWYDTASGRWLAGGRTLRVRATELETPLYIRDGAILPLARMGLADNTFEGGKVDFHLFLAGDGEVEGRYLFDDGDSFEYQKGGRTELGIMASRHKKKIEIKFWYEKMGFGKGSFSFTTEACIKEVVVNGKSAQKIGGQGVPLGRGKLVTWSV